MRYVEVALSGDDEASGRCRDCGLACVSSRLNGDSFSRKSRSAGSSLLYASPEDPSEPFGLPSQNQPMFEVMSNS